MRVTARSDLDRLMLPLLRNLYASTQRGANRKPSGYRNVRQLYLVAIVMLKFSQEYSFGDDAFQRIRLACVGWYENHNLQDVSLGSLIYLVLIRAITANLNTMRDEYLLSNW